MKCSHLDGLTRMPQDSSYGCEETLGPVFSAAAIRQALSTCHDAAACFQAAHLASGDSLVSQRLVDKLTLSRILAAALVSRHDSCDLYAGGCCSSNLARVRWPQRYTAAVAGATTPTGFTGVTCIRVRNNTREPR